MVIITQSAGARRFIQEVGSCVLGASTAPQPFTQPPPPFPQRQRSLKRAAGAKLDPAENKFSLQELRDKRRLPPSVSNLDFSRLEEYIASEEEFKSILGMSREAFAALPKWKQTAKKRSVDLF